MWRWMTIVCLWMGGVALPSFAFAQDPPPADPPVGASAPEAPSPAPGLVAQAELDAAIAAFLDGDSAVARDRLRALLSRGPELEANVRRDALAYLGDILMTEEGAPAARATLEALLDEDPTYRMDPIKHPPEVCRYFEDLRLSRRAFQPPPPTLKPQRSPFPVLAVLPLGVHWFAKKKVGTGLLVGGLQVAATATNIAFYTQVKNYDGYVTRGSEEEAEFIRMEVAADVSAAVAWGSWLLPASIEIGRWASAPRVTVSPTVGGMVLTGSF